MVGPKKQDFWARILQGMSVHQKLGIILESKVAQKKTKNGLLN